MTLWVSAQDVQRALGCSRSLAYEHLRRAAGRKIATGRLLRVPLALWENYCKEVFGCDSSNAKGGAGTPGTPSSTTPTEKGYSNDLHRTCATWLHAAGVTPDLIAPVMGHVDTRMVERVYGRLPVEDLTAQIRASLGLPPEFTSDAVCSAGAADVVAPPGNNGRSGQRGEPWGRAHKSKNPTHCKGLSPLMSRVFVCPETEPSRRHGDFQSWYLFGQTLRIPGIIVASQPGVQRRCSG